MNSVEEIRIIERAMRRRSTIDLRSEEEIFASEEVSQGELLTKSMKS